MISFISFPVSHPKFDPICSCLAVFWQPPTLPAGKITQETELKGEHSLSWLVEAASKRPALGSQDGGGTACSTETQCLALSPLIVFSWSSCTERSQRIFLTGSCIKHRAASCFLPLLEEASPPPSAKSHKRCSGDPAGFSSL